MSLARTISASQAEEYYYEKDPIMAPDGKGANSEWQGSLMNDFGFEKHISSVDFKSLLYGLDPKTQDEIVQVGVNKERRAGIDLVFSAPKSVSIVALHLGDKRIVDAHKLAVTKTLEFIQDNFIYYRDFVDGKLQQVQSDNMAAATYIHSTSRANDPQLHTHAVILNVTKTKEGKFKAISNEHIFKYQTFMNNIYQNELAINLQKLGYSIVNYENKFEIKGVPEEAIEIFSKRSKEIDAMFKDLQKKHPNETEARLMDIAVLASRKNKDKDITDEELFALWEEEFSKSNIMPTKDEVKIERDVDEVEIARNIIHENESTFNLYDLFNAIIIQNRGNNTLAAAYEKVRKALADGTIIVIGKKDGKEIISSKDMVEVESSIVAYARNSKNSHKPLLVGAKMPNGLTQGQEDFITSILETRDSVNIIQGDAGTGKTYAVKVLRDILEKEKSDVKLLGLGFTGKAAQELADSANIETSTIASFLHKEFESEGKAIIIVDEASMVSSRDMLALMKKASGSRIVFVGDGKQLQAIGAGKMFKELQAENVVKKIHMTEVLRQKTDITKAIVTHIKNKDFESTFNVLNDNKLITEVKSRSKEGEVTSLYLRQRAVEEYLRDKNSLMLTTSKNEKDKLNLAARRKVLSTDELLSSKAIKVKESVSSTGYIASSYKKDDIIIWNKVEGRVSKVDIDKNLIEIKSKGKTITLDPTKEGFTAYREVEKSFAKGEKIMFTRNDKMVGVQNGLSGTIEKIDDEENVYVNVKNKQIVFNLRNYSYLDYAYAQTVHKAQGTTCRKTIYVHAENDRVSSESFYVAASRATHEFKIITSNKEQLMVAVQNEQVKSSTRQFVKS